MERVVGSPSALHALGLGAAPRRLVRWCEADRPALVLGSTQPDAVVDVVAASHAGLEVVRRRSGGAAVLVGAGRLVWADVVLARADPLWSEDVSSASHWLGTCWARALESLGAPDVVVHAGAMVRGPWADVVCFAATAPGEVLARGRKIVGISQRRTRAGALFQVGVLLDWDPVEAAGPLVATPARRVAAVAELGARAVGLDQLAGRRVPASEVEEAFLASLAAATG